MNHTWFTKPHIFLILACFSFVTLGILRLNDTSLYTDSTRYVIWGTSFSHGRGFVDDTQPDAERYVVNAPLYSVVLAPVLLVFPDSLLAAKVWTLLIGVCSLVLFYVWLNRRLGAVAAIIGTLMLAFNPLMLVMATEAMSEMCFLALIALVMLLLDSFHEESFISSRDSIALVIILSVLPLLREVSVALVGAVVIVLLFKKRYASAIWVAVGTAVLIGGWMLRNLIIVGVPTTSQSANVNFILGHFVTPSDASLLSELFQRMLVNVQGLYIYAASLLLYPFPQTLIVDPHQLFRAIFKLLGPAKIVAPLIVVPLAVWGIVEDRRQNEAGYIRLLFCVLYALILAIYPVQDIRFLLPLLPFLIYYVLVAVRSILKAGILKNRTVSIGLVAFASAIVILPNIDCDFELERTNWKYVHSPDSLYQEIQRTGANKEIYTRPWSLFGDWIKQNLPDSTVMAGTYKELSIFVGDRKILEINYGVPVPMFERMLRDNGVEYLLSAGENESNRPYEFAMKESKRYWFEPVHTLNGLTLYKVHSAFMDPKQTSVTTATPDTTTVQGQLAWGRRLILRGDYSCAAAEIAQAYHRGSNPALTMYQLTVALAMAGERLDATKAMEKLYRLPQSTSYIPAARLHLRAMEASLDAKNITGLYQRSQVLFNVAAFYWNFGYREQGYTLLRSILEEDTTYFVGLLWGWDYARNLGDEKQADTYFRILESIDRTNAVVTGYRAINAIDDTLKRAKNPSDQSRLELEKGKVYWGIGLFDEAYDCVEKSIGENRDNGAAFQYLSELFEKTNKPWALRKTRLMMEGRL